MRLRSYLVCVLVLILVSVYFNLKKYSAVETLPPLASTALASTGESSCCSTASQHKLEELCPRNQSLPVVSKFRTDNCSCTDYMLCKLIFVTAFSSNHFKESLDYFASVHITLPQVKVIVYDLGLTAAEIHSVKSYCNVQEVRKFKFDKYPKHTKNLYNYAWKPLIVNEMSQEYELFFYCDAGCRIKSTFISLLPHLLRFPLVPAARLHSSVITTTHQGMLDYFGVKLNRSELVKILRNGFPGGIMLIWANDFLKNRILSHWIECAKHVECISPKGAKLSGCKPGPPSRYAECHRFDQSALNVLLIREFGTSIDAIFNDKGGIPTVDVVGIDRYPSTRYKNSKESHQCNILYW